MKGGGALNDEDRNWTLCVVPYSFFQIFLKETFLKKEKENCSSKWKNPSSLILASLSCWHWPSPSSYWTNHPPVFPLAASIKHTMEVLLCLTFFVARPIQGDRTHPFHWNCHSTQKLTLSNSNWLFSDLGESAVKERLTRTYNASLSWLRTPFSENNMCTKCEPYNVIISDNSAVVSNSPVKN